MSAPPDAPIEPALLVRRLTADRRRALRRALGVVLLAVVFGFVWSEHKERVHAFVRGEIDLEGRPHYEPRHPVDHRAHGAIDFERVHERLIPTWTMALARATTRTRRAWADRTFEGVEEEVAPDPNLLSLLRRTHQGLRDDPIANARRVDYALWAYNDYLDRNAIPWRLEASLSLDDEDRPIFRMLTYEVLADAQNREGHRVRLLRRADGTNLVEGWLGHTGDGSDGALVIMQRVLHFTARHVWPGLHPALDERRPAVERPWLGDVRREVEAALDRETFRLLSETAVDQQALIEVADSIAARRACGSTFAVRSLPYNGLTHGDRAAITRALVRSDMAPECPEITLDEAARIIGASERLAETDGLRDALERLAVVVARSVVAHELQHVEDGAAPACPGCPAELEGLARAEVSAYVGAFSTEGVGYLALFQACATPLGDGVHGAALGALLDVILPFGCAGPRLWGLYELAERIEAYLFGKRGDVHIPPLPPRVPLLPRSARAGR